MPTTVTIGGLNYYIPAVGENNWGQNVTDSLIALATAASANASVFNRVTVTSSPVTVVSGRTYLVDTSSARTLNLPAPANNAYLYVKDTTGSAASNNITVHRFGSESIDGVASDKTLNLNRGFWGFVSDGTNWFSITPPWPVPYSFLTLTGSIVNADIASGAAIAYSKLALAGSIVNADVASGAAIAVNKLAALTVSRAMVTDASGFASAAAVTATELGFVSGVTSAIQTQLAAKLGLAGGTLTGALYSTVATNKLSFNGIGTTGQIGNNYDLGSIPNASDTSAAISFLCPTSNASVQITTSDVANTAPATVATFQSAANGGCQLKGTGTNDNAAAGNIGEFIDSSVASLTSIGATGQFANVTSISLTAGDWDVSGNVVFSLGTGTGITNGSLAISAFSGNTTTDHVAGKNAYGSASYPTSTQDASIGVIPRCRISVASTTTIYLKGALTYSGGAPKFYGYISARRMR